MRLHHGVLFLTLVSISGNFAKMSGVSSEETTIVIPIRFCGISVLFFNDISTWSK